MCLWFWIVLVLVEVLLFNVFYQSIVASHWNKKVKNFITCYAYCYAYCYCYCYCYCSYGNKIADPSLENWVHSHSSSLSHIRSASYSRSTLWINETAIDPSSTAYATRLMLPPRTSPTAKIYGKLVSSKYDWLVRDNLQCSDFLAIDLDLYFWSL